MLPLTLKDTVFDKVSGMTMRKFFHPINLEQAEGLLKTVLQQSQRDFFINGNCCVELFDSLIEVLGVIQNISARPANF